MASAKSAPPPLSRLAEGWPRAGLTKMHAKRAGRPTAVHGTAITLLFLFLQVCNGMVPQTPPLVGSAAGGSLSPQVLQTMDTLYPPVEEFQRIQAARKDGYWPYISKKEEPPTEFTYGEFPLPFFADLVDYATAASASVCAQGNARSQAEFVDLGSGGGRLVLAAAAMTNPFKKVRGVEFLPSLHCLAEEKLAHAHSLSDFLSSEVELENCSWDAPELDLSSVDIAFACTYM